MRTNPEFEAKSEQAVQELLVQLTALLTERQKDGVPIPAHQLFTHTAEMAMDAVTGLALSLSPEWRATYYRKGYPSLDRGAMADYLAMKDINLNG